MSWIATEPRSLAKRQAMIARWEKERRAGGDIVFGMFIGGVLVAGCGLHRRLDAERFVDSSSTDYESHSKGRRRRSHELLASLLSGRHCSIVLVRVAGRWIAPLETRVFTVG
jgi:hypothetical protein